jgi:predicted RNA-binding protein with TRAM domain
MELPDDVLALYTAEIETSGGQPTIRVPESEVEIGSLEGGSKYRIAVLPPTADREEPDERTSEGSRGGVRGSGRGGPPVEEGEVREVEIEDVGDQGDGIARIGPGYVVFVPETSIGDRVTVEITEARENFAFGEVREEEPLAD